MSLKSANTPIFRATQILNFNLIESIFEEAATLSREVLLPINGQGDRNPAL